MRISDWSSDVCSSDLDYLALREQIRDEVTTQRLRNKEVDSRVVVTEQDVDAFLASASANSHNKYRLSDILILVPDEIGRASCRGRVSKYAYTSVVAGSLITKLFTFLFQLL